MSTTLYPDKSRKQLPDEFLAYDPSTATQQYAADSGPSLNGAQSLRQLCWEMGTHFPEKLQQQGVALLAVYPHLGFIQWHINNHSVTWIKESFGSDFDHTAKLVIRIYDVTNILFDGFNANRWFDIEIGELTGSYYLKTDYFESNLMAEVGYCFRDGRFAPCARSNTMYFDRPRKSSRLKTSGLYVNQAFTRVFPVENVACASLFDEMNSLLQRTGDHPISTALFLNEMAVLESPDDQQPVRRFLEGIISKCLSMGTAPTLFCSNKSHLPCDQVTSLLERIQYTSLKITRKFETKHRKTPFECIQCHDWYSAPAALSAAEKTGLPVIAVIHSTEPQRSGMCGEYKEDLSHQIEKIERRLIDKSEIVLTADESTKDVLVHYYKKNSDSIVIVPDTLTVSAQENNGDDYIRCRYGLSNQKPVILFAGQMSYSTGADLLIDSIPSVCGECSQSQFVFAGDGPLLGDLQHRAWCMGINHRCRFTGNVSSEVYHQLISVADIVVIPSRNLQDPALAENAIAAGKPVIATHQSRLHQIRHGVNGLLVYDNTGSVIWGLKEMLANPLRVLKSSVTSNSGLMQTTECIAAMYINKWALVALHRREKHNG